MLRRKLALYTLLYIAGIAAGFFMFERSRTIEAACFCAAVLAAVFFTDQSSSAGVFPHRNMHNDRRRDIQGDTRQDMHSDKRRAMHRDTRQGMKKNPHNHKYNTQNNIPAEKHLNLNKEALARQKTILAIVFLAGFLLFAFRSMSYNAAPSYVHDKNYIRGRITSVSIKDEKVHLIIRNKEAGPAKVLVILDMPAAEQFAAQISSSRSASEQHIYDRDEQFASSSLYGYTGTMVEARGKFAELSPAEDPGCFDYALYMKSKGITMRFKAYILEAAETGASPLTRLKRSLYEARESFISRFSSETQGFIRGVIFGDKSEIDDDLLEEFNINSTGHILAVSGLHIGFLYGLLRFLTARKRTLPVSCLIAAVILLYGEMTMWSPATVRACIVMTISLCSTHLRRRADLLTSVSLAAFLILTFQPYQLFSSGFQLSFLALCGIDFLSGPISVVTGEAIAVMLAVQIGTLPVIAYSYCRINPLSILINVPVILLASVLVPLCILLLMAEAVFGRVPAPGIDLAELISYAVIKVNHILSFGGDFSIRAAGPGAAAIVFIYILVFGLATEWTRVMLLRKDLKAVFRQGILLLMPLAMLFSCFYDSIADDEIVFVSVGQGDCVHIRAEGHDMLIDGGGQAGNKSSTQSSYESSSTQPSYDTGTEGSGRKVSGRDYNVGKSILMPYLMHGGVDAVDIALVTHLHADHYKGIEELSEIFPVGAIGVPADYRADFPESHKISSSKEQPVNPDMKIFYIGPDTKIDISDDVSIEAIWPVEVSDEPIAADDPNEHNTVYMIHYKDIKVMVTGDLLEADENEMIEYYQGTDTLECDILKVAHHGSKSSSSEEFLDAVKPEIAVIQCGRNNFYGHPHQQTLDRLEERGIRVFRTDLSGAVGIDIHKTRLAVDLFR